MRGVEEARKLVTAELEAQMPAKVDELAARYGLAPAAPAGSPDLPDTLPPIRLYAPTERVHLDLDEFPALLTARIGAPRIMPVDIIDGRVLYKVTYRLREYVYARGAGEDDVADAIDRYLLGVRELLLINLNLGTDGVAIDPTSLVESYSGIEPGESAGFVAAAFVEFAITIEETAAATVIVGDPADPSGPQVTSATVEVVPHHPALD